MALINLKDLLNHAMQYKYSVGGFAITHLDFLDCLIESALEEKSPIILQLAEVHFKYLDMEDITPAFINAAKKVNIPVCIHLDHGLSLKTIIRAIRAGFTSVMFDGSRYPLDENIRLTKEVIKVAHSVGVSVEAEVGHIGEESVNYTSKETIEDFKKEEFYTNVDEAKKFVQETNVDALAVAVGNVHGFYKGKTMLDFERIKKIRDTINIPLVLHGGSGISDEDFTKAISFGICKINYYTEMSAAAVKSIRDFLIINPDFNSYPDLINSGKKEIKKIVKSKLKVWGSSNRCASDKTLCILCDENRCFIEEPKFNPEAKTCTYKELVETITEHIISKLK